jgi:Holliday junction resolvase RusA-like endonuclease
MKFTIKGKLPNLNDYITECRGNKYSANTMKQRVEKGVIFAIRQARLKPVTNYPIKLKITWYEENMRRDIDNVTFATKFIQDAMVKAKIITNDGQKQINALEHEVLIDRKNPRIEIEIIEGTD